MMKLVLYEHNSILALTMELGFAHNARFANPAFYEPHTRFTKQAIACSVNRSPPSSQIEAVKIHDLGPSPHKILHEFFATIRGGIHLGHGSKLGIRSKHQIDRSRRPFEGTALTIVPLIYAYGRRGLTPLG